MRRMDWREDLGGMIKRDRAVGVIVIGPCRRRFRHGDRLRARRAVEVSPADRDPSHDVRAIPLPAARMLRALKLTPDPGAQDDPSRHVAYTWTIRAPIPGGCAGPSPRPSKLGVVITLECSP